MSRRAASLAAAALLLWAAGGMAATKTYRSAEWGFEFAYPDQFAVGRYKDTLSPERQARLRETGQESPFKHAIALVEPTRLGSRAPLDALPVGDIATITVTPARGQQADFDYYLVPLRDDLVVELFAQRRHMDQARTDTGYDRVIEGIIATFKTFPLGG